MPFVFNGLKICTTLALIGAIVAEFFGSPTDQGDGLPHFHRASASLALDMVWAEIVVAALVGSAFYGAGGADRRRAGDLLAPVAAGLKVESRNNFLRKSCAGRRQRLIKKKL